MAEPKEHGKCADICFILMRILLLAIAICAFVLSLSVTNGCDFFIFDPQPVPPGFINEIPPELQDIGRASVGLYRYDPDGAGCRDISDDFDDIGWQLTIARVGNSMASVFSLVALVCLVIDLFCCRFVMSRLILSLCYLLAFITQAFTFFVYAADICTPSFKNAANSCKTDTATYLSIAATVLFFVAMILVCVIPKPLPVFVRVKRSLGKDKTDPCCACWKRKKEEEEQEDLEKGVEDEEEDVTEEDEEDEEEEPKELTEEEKLKLLREQQAEAVVIGALAAARHGKQAEIEKQLEMLTTYKDHVPEEEYETRVAALLQALPDPDTYDAATKTDTIQSAKERLAEEKEREAEQQEWEEEMQQQHAEEEIDVDSVESDDEEEEEEEEKKKNVVTSAIASTGKAIGSGLSSIKKSVTPGFSSKATPAEAPQDAAVPDAAPDVPEMT